MQEEQGERPVEGPGEGCTPDLPEQHRLRVGDAERHRVAELLRQAAGEGRLDVAELEERLEAAYAARTEADLEPLVVDLPGAGRAPVLRPVAPPPSSVGAPRPGLSIALMSGHDRRGPWEVGAAHTALAVMGGVDLDLRQARFTGPEVVITAVAVMGGVGIVVDPHVRLSVEGIGVMGYFGEARPRAVPDVRDDAPLVRVRGVALMGSVEVRRGPSPDTVPRRPAIGRPRG